MLFSVSAETFLTDRPFIERLVLLAKAGFHLVEFWSWRDKDLKELLKAMKQYNLKVTTFAGQYNGDLLSDAGIEVYLKELAETIKVAQQLGCDKLMVFTNPLEHDETVKQLKTKMSLEDLHQLVLTNLRRAVALAEQNSITLLLEPLNTTIDHPGYYLDSSVEAFRLVDEVGSQHLKVLFDLYHLQIMEGNLITSIKKNITKIGYFHIADVPGRHEPGTGEINFHNILRTLETLRFNGVIGFECYPSKDPSQVLRSMKELVLEYD